MKTYEESIEVDVPVRTAYNQWTQFEDFPQFMEGVEQVQQLDDTHLRWKTHIAGKKEEWIARIVEQKPDKAIQWESESGADNAGAVVFDELAPDRTRVTLRLYYEPEGTVEEIGDALGFVERSVRKDLENFREFVQERGRETGAWRGEVHKGRTDRGDAGGAGAPAPGRTGVPDSGGAGVTGAPTGRPVSTRGTELTDRSRNTGAGSERPGGVH